MSTAGERLIKLRENIRKQNRQSRKKSRIDIINSKRNIVVEETKKELTEVEKLKLWKIEKKKKMEQEKLKRKPPFNSYIKVRHTGTSPFLQRPPVNKLGGIKNDLPRIAGVITRNFTLKLKEKENKRQEPFKDVKQIGNTLQLKNVPVQDKIREKPRTITQKLNNVTAKTVNEVIKKPLQLKHENKLTAGAAKKVPEIEKRTGTVRPNKPVTRSTTKTENNEPKSLNNRLRSKIRKKNNEENVPNFITSAETTSGNDHGKTKRLTRSRKILENVEAKVIISEAANGPTFQRNRLAEETAKLQELKEKWLTIGKEDTRLPEAIRDEILSVTGLTSLLITSKFEHFKSLIEECSQHLSKPNEKLRISPDDLDGFWEMMYIQVIQLHNKYSNLERLMLNNWVEPAVKKLKSKPKKTIIKTPMPKKNSKSRLQEFLNKRCKENAKMEPGTSQANGSKENKEYEKALNLDSLNGSATPKIVRNVINARKSRRSSLSIIMLMSELGKFNTPEK